MYFYLFNSKKFVSNLSFDQGDNNFTCFQERGEFQDPRAQLIENLLSKIENSTECVFLNFPLFREFYMFVLFFLSTCIRCACTSMKIRDPQNILCSVIFYID